MAQDAKVVLCKITFMIILTVIVFLIEITVGYVTKAQSLVADSFHMLSDVVAMVIAYYSIKLSMNKTRTPTNTFGWARAEDLGAMVNGVFLVALSFTIIVESIKRFYAPEDITRPLLVLLVGCLGLTSDVIGMIMFHTHKDDDGDSKTKTPTPRKAESPVDYFKSLGSARRAKLKNASNQSDLEQATTGSPIINEDEPSEKAVQVSNSNSEGIFLHVLADFFGSVIVCISAGVLLIWGNFAGSAYIDPALSLVSAGLIIWSTKPLLTRSASVLLQTVPDSVDVKGLEGDFLSEFAQVVLAIHDFHVWQLTGDAIIATTHVICDSGVEWSPQNYMRLVDSMKEFFHSRKIHSTTIQIEYRSRRTPTEEDKVQEEDHDDASHEKKNGNSDKDRQPRGQQLQDKSCVVACNDKEATVCCPIVRPTGSMEQPSN